MLRLPKQAQKLISIAKESEKFMGLIENLEVIVSKVLSVLMVVVIFVTVCDIAIFLFRQIFLDPLRFYQTTLFEVFGLFLNVLIALEILENITAYLRKHVVQAELVIITSLIAVARKIIIIDLEKKSASDLIGLGVAVFTLSISYLIIRSTNKK
ncbi:MAG: phosphate-starvation-inducible PsiE family protein [Hormoscilla sp. SP5CHS1]|nr:phosphate-starvation-inducible PsiE family protein [Hormoscilla sp. SP12CHS1]MBC6453168.1 phosphate-starvation-inducible PsiE family protein [Hormoscilla sp. SP5CHS1]MBC6476063.1 phosphate-starvation-inducible PsiE family protein [Hormoscilla sp. GM102CHS1]